jgi:hypothetical protein
MEGHMAVEDEAEVGTATAIGAEKKKSQRNGEYTIAEDRFNIFRAWIAIIQDPICGAEKMKNHIGGRWPNISPSVG